jgi:exoribonuclease II
MPLPKTRPGSLVLYKKRPARVEQIGQKLKIEQIGGQTLNVRPKDVDLLHPGPVGAWPELAVPAGEVETAWEILAGTTTRLAELAELVYGHYSPATAWASWQLVDDGLYFHGSVDRVEARPAEDVARIRAAREVKEAETQAWAEFVDRVRQQRLVPDDSRFLGDVEDVAYGRQNQSRLLRELGWTETPETAHRLLLDLHRWDHTRNPYPARQGVTTVQPEVELPALADETRLDLTHLPAFAIDDEGTRDPDDALSLDGNRLWVHVADVSALVLPDSPADLEAAPGGQTCICRKKRSRCCPGRQPNRWAWG